MISPAQWHSAGFFLLLGAGLLHTGEQVVAVVRRRRRKDDQ